MWECLNVTWRTMPERRRAAARLGPNTYLDYVRERTAMFSGLAESTLSHDDGWHFLVLGRSLERADMTARLLSVQLLTADQPVTWVTVLSACGGYEAFLHTHGGMVDRSRAVQFLALDRSFPRSVLHSLSTAEQCLAALNPQLARNQAADPARRVVGQARTTLEYVDVDRTRPRPERAPRAGARGVRECEPSGVAPVLHVRNSAGVGSGAGVR